MLEKQNAWHALSLDEIKNRLKADFEKGLNEKEVEARLEKFGKNIFEKEEGFYYLKLLWRQLKSALVFILIIAGAVALFLGEYTDAIVIFIAVVINTAIGVFQEGKASQAFKKLKSSQKKYSAVIRDGRKKVIESSNLVPGDIIILQLGDQVPADARLIEEKGIEANEAVLTGEWIAVDKGTDEDIPERARITERKNMLWMGTFITEGWGKAVVVSTGFDTEIGKIAEMIGEEKETSTPLQKGIKKLARFLGLIIGVSILIIFVLGLVRGEPLGEMLLVSVALAVAAVPSGLPIAVTVVLAIGMGRILAKKGLIKNLNAAETLGSTSVILTDKTGTLTKAEMTVSKIMTLLSEKEDFMEKKHKDRLQVLEMAVLATEAFIENPEDELKEWIVRGRPMDRAIYIASIEAGIRPLEVFKKYPRIDFIPFDSERRYNASMHKLNGSKSRVFAMGAPELVLGFCEKVYENGKELKLTEERRDFLEKMFERENSSGARMLAIAYKDGDWQSFPHHGKKAGITKDMVFGGFIRFHDPLRDDVFEAIRMAKAAGIRLVMATGDHIATARKVAEEAGLLRENGLVITGEEFEKISPEEISEKIEEIDVFARVLPSQKLKIVRIWQEKGEVVAMTGDGVNDAPALKHADIGIAVGSATEVSKEASDMILLNNSFSIIVTAIAEGRRILDNLKKIIAYLLSTAFSEIFLVGVAIIAGFPLPVLPTQILWTNIIEEGFMNFAFAFEPQEKGLMERDPRKQSAKNLLTKQLKELVFLITALTSVILIVLFFVLLYLDYPIDEVRTIMFAGISIDSIFFAFSLKNLRKPVWKINIFSNYYLIFSLLISVLLLAAALFIPVLQKLLTLVPLSGWEIILILGLGFLNLLSIEMAKYLFFEKRWHPKNL